MSSVRCAVRRQQTGGLAPPERAPPTRPDTSQVLGRRPLYHGQITSHAELSILCPPPSVFRAEGRARSPGAPVAPRAKRACAGPRHDRSQAAGGVRRHGVPYQGRPECRCRPRLAARTAGPTPATKHLKEAKAGVAAWNRTFRTFRVLRNGPPQKPPGRPSEPAETGLKRPRTASESLKTTPKRSARQPPDSRDGGQASGRQRSGDPGAGVASAPCPSSLRRCVATSLLHDTKQNIDTKCR